MKIVVLAIITSMMKTHNLVMISILARFDASSLDLFQTLPWLIIFISNSSVDGPELTAGNMADSVFLDIISYVIYTFYIYQEVTLCTKVIQHVPVSFLSWMKSPFVKPFKISKTFEFGVNRHIWNVSVWFLMENWRKWKILVSTFQIILDSISKTRFEILSFLFQYIWR